uniref:CMP/dCMP-type deaminase domain-containing protein n=1 Tax=Podarcis muralis TaxID=64176 RepID=A0A670KLX7_PODMU
MDTLSAVPTPATYQGGFVEQQKHSRIDSSATHCSYGGRWLGGTSGPELGSNAHAEVLVLDYIVDQIAENITKENYELNLFVSYTPCHECSVRIKSFMEKNNGICMEIKASRPYYFNREGEQKGLHLLKSSGVSIKMMNKSDYEECFALFVHPSENFTPWSDLDEQSCGYLPEARGALLQRAPRSGQQAAIRSLGSPAGTPAGSPGLLIAS